MLYLTDEKADKYNWRHFQLSDGRHLDIEAMSNGNKNGQFKGQIGYSNYSIINLPYTSYGYVGNHWFYNYAPSGYISRPDFKDNYLVTTESNGSERILKPEVRGSATYHGPVLREGGEYDGTVTLHANFDKTAESSHISGKIDSKHYGTIDLEKTNLQWHKASLGVLIVQDDGKTHNDALRYEGKAKLGDYTGTYQGAFAGPKLANTSGIVKVGNYEALFGGERK